MLSLVAGKQAPDEATRHTFIGGSEAHELLNEPGYSGRGCARALQYRKLQTPPDVPSRTISKELQALYDRGHKLEEIAARDYMDQTGRALIKRARLVRNPEHPGAGVHTDRIILAHRIVENGHATDQSRPTGDAELKSHGEGMFLHILRAGLPASHNLQLQWSFFCTGHKWGAFIILGVFGGLPLKYFDVERDEVLMQIFAGATEDFWRRMKNGDMMPQLEDPGDRRCKVCPYRLKCRGEMLDPAEVAYMLRERDRVKPLVEIRNADLDEALGDREKVLAEQQAAEEALELVNDRIRELMGEVEAADVEGRWHVYHAAGKWTGLNQKLLREEQPEIAKKYTVTKLTEKQLRIYAVGSGRSA
jgi:hypothetical protein